MHQKFSITIKNSSGEITMEINEKNKIEDNTNNSLLFK